MNEAPSRDLRNNTRALLRRAQAGETITITVDGRPAALLAPLDGRPRWVGRGEFLQRVLKTRADPDLRQELRELAPGSTDDFAL